MHLRTKLSSMHLKRTAGVPLVVVALLAEASHAGETQLSEQLPYYPNVFSRRYDQWTHVLLAYVCRNSSVLLAQCTATGARLLLP